MPFPAAWPPRVASGRRSVRFYVTGTATALFADRAFMLLDAVVVLDYVARVAAFTIGEVVTGQVSGATAVVVLEVNAGATGTLTLQYVTGTFNPSEQILGSISGNATTSGVVRMPANPYTPLPEVTGGSTVVPLTPSGTGVASNGTPAPMIWAQTIRICNDGGAALEYSFDGTNVHGKLLAAEQTIFRHRFEAGIAVRGAGAVFRIEAW
jgi:hypothetical protein